MSFLEGVFRGDVQDPILEVFCGSKSNPRNRRQATSDCRLPVTAGCNYRILLDKTSRIQLSIKHKGVVI